MNTILSYANPLEFYIKNFVAQAQYNSKHMNDVPFEQQIYPWQQKKTFRQPWQTNNSIRIQLRSDAGTIAWKLYTCIGQLIDTDNFQTILQNADNPGEYVYQADIDLSPYAKGNYRIEIEIGVGNGIGGAPEEILISEEFEISDIIENSLVLEYRHSSFKDEIMFETGFAPEIRIYGQLIYKEPASKDTVYEDQELNETIVDSKTYDLWELQLNDVPGIPNWMIRKLNCILGYDSLIIDGRKYTKSEGAKLEKIEIDKQYPMRGWKIELREQLNRRAKFISSVGTTNQGIVVIANVDSKGFVENETGGSEFQITDIN